MICPICKVRWAPYPKTDWKWEWSEEAQEFYPISKDKSDINIDIRRNTIFDGDILITCGNCSL